MHLEVAAKGEIVRDGPAKSFATFVVSDDAGPTTSKRSAGPRRRRQYSDLFRQHVLVASGSCRSTRSSGRTSRAYEAWLVGRKLKLAIR